MRDDLSRRIGAQLGPLFVCSETSRGGVRVRTPLLYPDGGVIDVFVVEGDDGLRVTDFGEALGWLRTVGGVGERSADQQRRLEEVCRCLGVGLRAGELAAGCDVQEVGRAVVRLAQVAATVGNLGWIRRPLRVKVLDAEALGSLEGERVSAWLRAHGWRVVAEAPGRCVTFAKATPEGLVEVDVPGADTLRDRVRRYAELLDALEAVEGLTQGELLWEIGRDPNTREGDDSLQHLLRRERASRTR